MPQKQSGLEELAGKPKAEKKSLRIANSNALRDYRSLTSNVRSDFLAFINANGAGADSVEADGLVHRVSVVGDKSRQQSGWYVLHLDGIPSGVFGNWKLLGDRPLTWSAGVASELSETERTRLRDDLATARELRAAAQARRQEEAQATAKRMWALASTPLATHGYLVKKKIGAHGIRQLDRQILVPMRDETGRLWNLQRIESDGAKRFLYGGRCGGLYHAIGKAAAPRLLIAEGYATSSTLHEVTGEATACAFTANNLERVALILRAKFPAAHITICGDDDAETERRIGRNPGRDAAARAARSAGARLAFPPAGCTDFNDAVSGAGA